jgi:hypothetical protein
MHYRVHFLRRQVDVGLTIVGHEEAMAVAMPLDCALQFGQQA